MKKSLIAMALLLTLSTSAGAAAQKHRHNPSVTAPVQDPNSGNPAANINVNDNNGDEDSTGIVAYSDTTSTDTATAVAPVPVTINHDWDDDFDLRDLKDMLGWGIGGTFISIFVIIFFLLVCLAPFIAIVVVIWLIVRNRNQRLRLAEKAMEQGQPIPQEALKSRPEPTDEGLWERGLRNFFLGLGLFVCGFFFIGNMLKGIGVVMLFYGLGQAFIARSSERKNRRDMVDDDIAPSDNRRSFYEEFNDQK